MYLFSSNSLIIDKTSISKSIFLRFKENKYLNEMSQMIVYKLQIIFERNFPYNNGGGKIITLIMR